MAEVRQYSPAETEGFSFRFGQEVTITDLRAIVAPQNSLDEVEKARLGAAAAHVNEWLRSDLPTQEAEVHEMAIYHLGAEAVMSYLPERLA